MMRHRYNKIDFNLWLLNCFTLSNNVELNILWRHFELIIFTIILISHLLFYTEFSSSLIWVTNEFSICVFSKIMSCADSFDFILTYLIAYKAINISKLRLHAVLVTERFIGTGFRRNVSGSGRDVNTIWRFRVGTRPGRRIRCRRPSLVARDCVERREALENFPRHVLAAFPRDVSSRARDAWERSRPEENFNTPPTAGAAKKSDGAPARSALVARDESRRGGERVPSHTVAGLSTLRARQKRGGRLRRRRRCAAQ